MGLAEKLGGWMRDGGESDGDDASCDHEWEWVQDPDQWQPQRDIFPPTDLGQAMAANQLRYTDAEGGQQPFDGRLLVRFSVSEHKRCASCGTTRGRHVWRPGDRRQRPLVDYYLTPDEAVEYGHDTNGGAGADDSATDNAGDGGGR